MKRNWRNCQQGFALLVMLAAVSLVAVACAAGPKGGATPPNLGRVAATASASATGIATPAAAGPEAAPDNAPLAEFLLPKFSVSGKIVVKGIDPATNTMQPPDNKDDVAYYDFTPRPGSRCQGPDKCPNTVLSGHVDWYTGQTGVFWKLKDLKDGDAVQLKLQDGKLYTYKVVANTVYKAASAPVEEILSDTPQEAVTLITCEGVFNKSLQEYDSRRVVRAVLQS